MFWFLFLFLVYTFLFSSLFMHSNSAAIGADTATKMEHKINKEIKNGGPVCTGEECIAALY